MKTKVKIILYLDGQLTDSERAAFEKELSENPELKNEFTRYHEFMENIDSLKNIKADSDYFINMIPEFKKIIGTKKKSGIIPKLAIGLTTITAVILVLVFSMKQTGNQTANPATASSLDSLVDSYTYNYSPLQDQFDFSSLSQIDYTNIDSAVNEMLSDELNLSSQSLSDISNSNGTSDLQSMLQGINNDEADQIYNELLHKKIY